MNAHAIPYSFDEAKAAAARASRAQATGEQALREASKKLAEAEQAYRVALAQAIVRLHAEGAAWSVSGDLARGDKHVADLRYSRDVAQGVFEAAQTVGWRHSADRKDVLELIRWSLRVAPDGQRDDPRDLMAAA